MELLVNIIHKAMNKSISKQRLCAQSISGFDGECKKRKCKLVGSEKYIIKTHQCNNGKNIELLELLKEGLLIKKTENAMASTVKKLVIF